MKRLLTQGNRFKCLVFNGDYDNARVMVLHTETWQLKA